MLVTIPNIKNKVAIAKSPSLHHWPFINNPANVAFNVLTQKM